jgi:hypothetical protein
MAYMTDIGEILAKQLAKFVTLNRHQLAGQAANLDFWSAELQHCLDVIDGYKSRFNRMRDAQMTYATEHRTTEFGLDPHDTWGSPGSVVPPKRIDHQELEAVRQDLCDAMRRFLVRCRNESLIDDTTFQETTARFGIVAETTDDQQ